MFGSVSCGIDMFDQTARNAFEKFNCIKTMHGLIAISRISGFCSLVNVLPALNGRGLDLLKLYKNSLLPLARQMEAETPGGADAPKKDKSLEKQIQATASCMEKRSQTPQNSPGSFGVVAVQKEFGRRPVLGQ